MANTNPLADSGPSEFSTRHQHELQHLINAIELPIIRTDLQLQVQGLNRAAAALIGHPVEACIGKTCHTLLNLNGSTIGAETIERAMMMAESQVAETVVYPQGRAMPIKFGSSPLFDAAGEVNGAINYLVHDLSGQKELLLRIHTLGERIADGDLNARADAEDLDTTNAEIIDLVNGVLDHLIGQIQESDRVLDQAVHDAGMLAMAAHDRRSGARADLAAYSGRGGALAEELNRVMVAYDESTAWFTSVLDAIPFPLSITDQKMNWTFINRPVETFLGIARDQAIGRPCSSWGAPICHSPQCGIAGLKNGTSQTFFDQNDGHFKVDTSYVYSAAGEPVGHVEVVQDITSLVNLSEYFSAEVAKVNANLALLAAGSLEMDFTVGATDETTAEAGREFAAINQGIDKVATSLSRMVSDTEQVNAAIVHGRFRVRADEEAHQGVYRSAIKGVNRMVDAQVGYLDAIPAAIFTTDNDCTLQYMNRYAAAIVGISPQQTIGKRCSELVNADACGTGGCIAHQCLHQQQNVNVDMVVRPRGQTFEVNVTGIPIRDKDGQVTGSMEFMKNLTVEKAAARTGEKQALYQDGEVKKVVGVLERIADGELTPPAPVAPFDEETGDIAKNFEQIRGAIQRTVDNIQHLATDTKGLSLAAVRGELSNRVDISTHHGEYRTIVKGVNETLDAVIDPLNVAAAYVDKISRGEIPEKITDQYNGDFNQIKNNLNACIDGLEGLVEANAVLQRMAVNDYTRGVEGNYPGLFGEVKAHVNTVRTRVNHIAETIEKIGAGDLSDYKEYQAIGWRSPQDRVVPGLIQTLENLQGLTEDTGMLARAAIEGRLETRAEASRHQGEYRKVVEGVNKTLDAVIGPLNEAKRVSQVFAQGDFSTRVDRSVPVAGDFLVFRDALDNIGVEVSAAIGAVSKVSSAYAGYDFTTRIDESVHLAGDFVMLGESLNNIGVEVSRAFRTTRDQVHDLNEYLMGVRTQVDEINRGSQQVAVSTTDVSENTGKAMIGTQQVLKAMEDMSAAVEEVTASMESVAHLAREANDLSRDGALLAGKAEESMGAIANAGDNASRIVSEIGGQMNDIGKIVRIIRELANQTNLLALNAAIEAARAGDAGRGFAVVAAEVKSLAQESRNSAEHIEELIGSLRSKSEEALIAMNEAGTLIEQGDQVLGETLQSFNQIVVSVQKISQSAEEVASATEEQAATVEEITASIHEVNALIEETTKDATDVAAATEEASASTDEITRMIGEAQASSGRVRDEIAVFRV